MLNWNFDFPIHDVAVLICSEWSDLTILLENAPFETKKFQSFPGTEIEYQNSLLELMDFIKENMKEFSRKIESSTWYQKFLLRVKTENDSLAFITKSTRTMPDTIKLKSNLRKIFGDSAVVLSFF